MKEITKSELKVLKALELNGRMGFSEIAKKKHMSNELVKYTFHNLLKKGIIKSFSTIVDSSKIGYQIYFVLIKIANISKDAKEKLSKHLRSIKEVSWFVETIGDWDLLFAIHTKDNLQLYNLLNRVQEQTVDLISYYKIIIHTQSIKFPLRYLFKKEMIGAFKYHSNKDTQITKNEEKILHKLKEDPRINLKNLCNELNISFYTAKQNIQKLISKGIILRFKSNVNVSKIGYYSFITLLELKPFKQEEFKKLLSYLKFNKNVVYINYGPQNMILNIHNQSYQDYDVIIHAIKEKFGKIIYKIDTLIVNEEDKLKFNVFDKKN